MKQFSKAGLDILAARELINTPEKWCKGSMALVANGKTRYCMLGAMEIIGCGDDSPAVVALYRAGEKRGHPVIGFNDARYVTHEQVMDFMLFAAREAA